MHKFRTLLATALLTLPIVTLASTTTDVVQPGMSVEATTSFAPCCMVLINGRWYCIPC